MKRLGVLLALGVAVLATLATGALALTGRDAAVDGPVGVHITPLSQAVVPAHATNSAGVVIKTKGRREMLVTAITVDPAGSFGWHTHPGPVLVSVSQGTLTLYERHGGTCRRTVVKAGEGFIEGGGDVHLANNEGTTPVELNATFLARLGTTEFLTTVPRPAGCSA